MKVISGKIDKAERIIIYGPEGIGKSTFASQFPKPIFIDVEGGTNHIDCDRLERPMTFTALMQEIKDCMESDYKTIVVDTIDWAEQLAIEQICRENNVESIEAFGYGKGYTYILDYIGKLLNRLWDAAEHGQNVILLAHSVLFKQERPNEAPFDRYQISLSKKTYPIVKKWADMVLFVNYDYIIYDEKGSTKKKVSGGKRVMYTTHNPCWDSKNRSGLPDKLDFEYKLIAHDIPGDKAFKGHPQAEPDKVETKKEPPKEPAKKAEKVEPKKAEPKKQEQPKVAIPKELEQLMEHDKVSMGQIMGAVYEKGYFPHGTQFEDLPDDFVKGCIIAGWNKGLLKLIRDMEEVPF